MNTLGKIKVIFNRSRSYATGLNTLMIFYLVVKNAGFHWWYCLVIPLFTLLIWIDVKYIIGQERDYIWTRKGEVKDLLENIKYIKEHLENG